MYYWGDPYIFGINQHGNITKTKLLIGLVCLSSPFMKRNAMGNDLEWITKSYFLWNVSNKMNAGIMKSVPQDRPSNLVNIVC